MENYTAPEVEIVEINNEDVIKTSLVLPEMPFGSTDDQNQDM